MQPSAAGLLWPVPSAARATGYTSRVLEIIQLDWVPLTCVRPIGKPSDQELAESLQSITRVLAEEWGKQRKSVMIIDMRKAAPLSAPQRRTASEWMKNTMELFKQVVIGGVFVIDSPIIRGVLTALLWLQPMEMPYEVVRDLDDAVRWAIGRFDAAHVPVPPRLHDELGRAFE
jgi:hypothetical protein